jgi:tRNA 2-selenouridine synthase
MSLILAKFLELRKTLPVIDVRSEGEYQEGHIRGAINIPILNNAERKAVGTDYKQKGRDAAIVTGFQLVEPRLKAMMDFTSSVAPDREILVHCWRGGLRSSHFCQFAEREGIRTQALAGGYKSYRHRALETFGEPLQIIVVGGLTGSGKSEVLRAMRDIGEQVIDLEGLAMHKGSVFGGLMMPPQPTTEQFQNELFEEIMALDSSRRIWVEDESIAIGKIFLPEPFWRKITSAPVIEIQVDRSKRTERLVMEYGHADPEEFLEAMTKIERKMGGQHFNAAKEKLAAGDMYATIDLLLNHYDKVYTTGLANKQHRIVHKAKWDGIDPAPIVAELTSLRPALSL